MARTNFETLDVYRLAEKLADEVWIIASNWAPLPRDTVGKQLIRASDGIGANIAEGVGRGSFQVNRRFIRIARGWLNETKHWLRRAYKRRLLDEEKVRLWKPMLDALAPRLNAYLKSIGESKRRTTDNRQRTTDNGQRS
jgi:four helix bundle protein